MKAERQLVVHGNNDLYLHLSFAGCSIKLAPSKQVVAVAYLETADPTLAGKMTITARRGP